jgi:glycerate dehydrogenase
MHGVFLDIDTLDRGDLDITPLSSLLTRWTAHGETPPSEVTRRIRDAEIVISNKVVLDAPVLHSATRLKLVCISATGTNNVDLDAARERGITVCNVSAYATPSVVEHVFSQLLILVRNLNQYREAVASGRWQQSSTFCLLDYPIRELAGMSLGIIGHGELGQAVAAMGRAFGMDILVAERPGQPLRTGRTPLETLLKTANVISLHCTLNAETRNLIGDRELGLMREDAILINTARGGLVDETALADALRNGRIAGAAVDVLTTEPPVDGNPLLDSALPNLLVTPHIAWASTGSRQRLINEIAGNISAWQAGIPRNVVKAKPSVAS